MSGAIMPAPLAMPQIVTALVPSRTVAAAPFRKRVGGHDRLGRRMPAAGRRVGDEPVHHAVELRRRRAARRSRRSKRGTPRPACSLPPWRRSRRSASVAARPDLPVKALALPELTTSARAPPRLEPGAAPVDRRRRAFRAGEDAGDRGAGDRTAPAARRCGRHSGCRPPRSRAARRRPAACPERTRARGERWRWT